MENSGIKVSLGELAGRTPHLITCQNIVVDGVKYDLLSMNDWKKDWAGILKEQT